MDLANISYLGILVAAFAGMITGAAWYGMLAGPWMKAAGVTDEDVQNGSKLIYLVAIGAQLIIAYLMSVLFSHFPSVTMMDGIMAAFFLWLGFCVAPMAVNHRFQGKGWDLTAIDGGFWLVVFLLQGAILGWWIA